MALHTAASLIGSGSRRSPNYRNFKPVALIQIRAAGDTLVLVFARLWAHVQMSPWRLAFEKGLAPVAVGLIAASGLIVARGADHAQAQYVLTALATVVFCTTRVQPLLVVGLAGLAGWLGLV